MAKRFTDTSKWAKESFWNLSPKMKLVWLYLCDNCDHAGIWDINLSLLSFQIGETTTLDEIQSCFKEKIEIYENKLFLPSFVEFQYGALNEDNRVHSSVLSRLKTLAPYKDLISPLHGAKDKDKDKDMVKEKEKEESEENEISLFEIWNEFRGNLPEAKSFSEKRRKQARARLRENPEEHYWIEVVKKLSYSGFCNGQNERGWVADFDFFLKPDTHLKVLEGKYTTRQANITGMDLSL